MKEDKINKSLSRVPQSLSFDNRALLRTFDYESTIIRDLIIYAGSRKMSNLFNEVSFTIEDFCTEFGYNRTTLQRTLKQFVDDPKLIPVIDGHKFDSLFEYALFRALKENIIFSRKREGKETFETVQIIERLEVFYNKSTHKTTKRSYNVKLSTKILDYLFTEYNLIDYNEYRAIQANQISTTGAMRNFYIYMGRMVAIVKQLQKTNPDSVYTLSVDELCTIFGVDLKINKHKKEYVKKTLESLQSEIKSMLFDWKFITKNTRYSYFVEFYFPQSTIEYFDEQRRTVFYKKLYNAATLLYAKTKIGEPKDDIRIKLANLSMDDFFNWFADGDEDIEIRKRLFKQTYEEVYQVEYNFPD